MSIWTERSGGTEVQDVSGWDVQGIDGSIGKVDAATDTGGDWLVVDTGVWIFGKKRALPVSCIDRVDVAGRTVYLNRMKAEVKEEPDWEPGFDARGRG